MSASEKLKTAVPWDQWRDWLNRDVMDMIEGDDMERLLNALPQIVLVVMWAERFSDYEDYHAWTNKEHPRLEPELDAALAALEEALS